LATGLDLHYQFCDYRKVVSAYFNRTRTLVTTGPWYDVPRVPPLS